MSDIQLLSPVLLESGMRAIDVLRRFAAHGLWLDADHPAVQDRVAPLARRLQRPPAEIARQLQRDLDRHGAAIRREWEGRILWYVRPAHEVIARCQAAGPDAPLIFVLNLHDLDSVPAVAIETRTGEPLRPSVLLDAGWPVRVAIEPPRPKMATTATFRSDAGAAAPAPQARPVVRREDPALAAARAELVLWPRLDAPEVQSEGQAFDVVVGFGTLQQPGVSGAQAHLPLQPGQDWLDITVELTTTAAIASLDGWQRVLRVQVAEPTLATVRFRLAGRPPVGADGIALAMLEVRYILQGTVCGTASRPIVILAAGRAAPAKDVEQGEAWLAQADAAAPVQLQADLAAPDLTLEILKPDRNASSGAFTCRLCSPHALAATTGPFDLRLGNEDARSFAKQLVDDLRMAGTSPALLDLTLEATGRLIAGRLPPEFFAALQEAATLVAPAVPAVLIVSAEPYVPWELAWLEAPIDAARPAYLGAQAMVGRWLRDGARPTTPASPQRPATHPKPRLAVKTMAVMAAWYKMETGFRRLPKAEEEAQTLARQLPAVLLKARAESVQHILLGKIPGQAGAIGAVHFAGHGNFDPMRPDGATLYLEDGAAVQSTLFRAARYGGEQQPLMFLNACMGGIGGDVLGDIGGFPGHSLRGGFGGVVGALWEIDDGVAHDVALDFWQRALPTAGQQPGEPVGAILRDMRGRYRQDAPVPTYLAYVYYGHPRLTLQRLQ